MARADGTETVSEIVTETGRYLQRVEAATEQLADIMEAYDVGEPAFETAVADLRDLESECDTLVGDLRSLVGSAMDPNFTGLYLRSGALVEFYEAAVHLSRAGTTQFDALTDPNRTGEVSREAEQIRAVETRCDDVKYRVLDHAFTSMSREEALVVRALVNQLDEVTNAVEDAVDRLVYLDQYGR